MTDGRSRRRHESSNIETADIPQLRIAEFAGPGGWGAVATGHDIRKMISNVSDCNLAKITPEQFRRYLPMACAWAVEQERIILEKGIPLSASQLSDAKLAGVVRPERVRLLRVEQVPVPANLVLRSAAEAMRLITPATAGLALRYGIFIRSACWGERRLVVLELAHTSQYERLGSIPAYLECYLYECLFIGYPSAPMEQEAIAVERRLCGQAPSLGIRPPPVPQVPAAKPSVRQKRPHR